MSTKEVYDRAIVTFSDLARGYRDEFTAGELQDALKAIEAHLAAKDAEIAELRAKYELQLDAWKRDGAKIAELSTAYISLYARIEAAPVIHIACQGSAGVGVSTPKHAAFEGEGEWKAFHAVPVEEEK